MQSVNQKEVYHFNQIPDGSIWFGIRQGVEGEKRNLEKRVRRGELVKVKAYWICGARVRTVYVKVAESV